jgi:Ca-activated chloride channel family protein
MFVPTRVRRMSRSLALVLGGFGLCVASLFACSYRTAPPAGAPALVASESGPALDLGLSREQYEHLAERPFLSARAEPLSTFSIDVDSASYSNVRRFLGDGALPPKDAVRVEELINYFDYAYPAPGAEAPLALYAELGECPWNAQHRLLHLGLRARELPAAPASNLVFLLDVSGSMQDADKLPLVKRALRTLLARLSERDRISIVVYAGSEGLVLPPTSGQEQGRILAALDQLEAGGSTNGGAGIVLAYRTAREAFIRAGVNRVILATDGDFNVGVSSQGELVRLIERERESGVFLTVLGFGTGNLQDHTLESLADHGNGNYAYIDSLREAEKVLGREATSTLVSVAKDVKIQVELNPREVASYRLIGYENRALSQRDFSDDRKDAGELGAGDTVTALYEIVPAGAEPSAPERLRYQSERDPSARAESGELASVAVRYQAPEGSASRLLELPVNARARGLAETSPSYRWAAAVAGFGLLLRGSAHAGEASYQGVLTLARGALGDDPHGDRAELLSLIQRADRLARAERAAVSDGSRTASN